MRTDWRNLGQALALTLASAMVWGLAHLVAGRTRTGLALAGAYTVLLGAVFAAATAFRPALLELAVRPNWLTGLILAALAIGFCWSAVIVSSYRLVRPLNLDKVERGIATGVVSLLCVLVVAPMAYAGRLAYVSRDVLLTVFNGGVPLRPDPWARKPRLNVLLVGADAARNRPGARTDSVTVASVDTRTGDTVLFGLPRNLEHVPMPPGPARNAFPWGFSGDGDEATPGLLNEVYQWAEDHPSIVPGAHGDRGMRLLRDTVSGILGLHIDYYAMLDMKGFTQIVNAIGGVTVTIRQDIPYGLEGGVLEAGRRRLDGQQALWFGRSRTDSDDYVRMGRQKCLLNAVAKQADPVAVLRGFERIADATKRYVTTDVPQSMLPALLKLSEKIKKAHIRSLQFVPPLVNTADPDWGLIQREVGKALRPQHPRARHSRAEHPRPRQVPQRSPRPAKGPSSPGTAQSLDSIC
ncbi:LCP family protein [Microtetraspora sp. NBRC 16547]|uniref:LCP family protein n=1 Tax=Microtetraspora sp. NBRC 16547 TaxID=3030993 RepID=UPI002553DEE8|nr:LCP family protein [Microtetraspora sp. NBRC 16547]